MAAAAAPAVRRERRAERFGPGNTPAGRRRALTVAPAPRRVSGPSRRQAPPRRRPRQQAGAERGLVLAAASAVAQLPLLWPSRLPLSHSRVARKVGPTVLARIWIGLVAFALIGIVTLQLVLLKLNTDIGHALAQSSVLQRENAALSIENSESLASNRVESRAEGIGMELMPAGSLRFLAVGRGADVARAAGALSTTQHSSAASGETSVSGSGAPEQPATTATGGESSAGESSPSLAAGGSAGASTAQSTTASGESAAGSPAGASTESTGATPSGGASTPAGAPATATAPSGSSAEAAPAGGTQADARG